MKLESSDGKYAVYFSDASNMKEVANESVNLIVTSPPYGLAMNYGSKEGQIECEINSFGDYDHFIFLLNKVWDECWRVLAPGGYAIINTNNTFARKVVFGEVFVFNTGYDLLKKWFSLGAFNKATMYWQGIRSSPKTLGSYPYPLEGSVKREFEEIYVFRKPKNGAELSEERKARRKASTMTAEEYKEIFTQLWKFNGANVERHGDIVHPAPFPLELPMRCIRGYSVIDDVVLDPFLGTGTTMLAAKKLGRRCIGYELEEKFSPIIQEKTGIFVKALQ